MTIPEREALSRSRWRWKSGSMKRRTFQPETNKAKCLVIHAARESGQKQAIRAGIFYHRPPISRFLIHAYRAAQKVEAASCRLGCGGNAAATFFNAAGRRIYLFQCGGTPQLPSTDPTSGDLNPHTPHFLKEKG